MPQNKMKYRNPRRTMPGQKLPDHATKAVEDKGFGLAREREFTGHAQFQMLDTANEISGMRGFHINKLSEDDVQAHGISLDVEGEPRWELIADGDTDGGGWGDFGIWDNSAEGYAVRVSPQELATNGAAPKFHFAVGAATPAAFTGFVTIKSPAAAMRALVLQGHASQSDPIQEWQSSAGSVLGQFEPDGDFTITGRLSAVGTAALPSRFTATDTGSTTRGFPMACRHMNSGGAGGTLMGSGMFFEVESATEGSINSIGSIGCDALTNGLGTQNGRFFLRAAVGGTNTDIFYASGQRCEMPQAPAATANRGLFNLGNQGFEGGGGTNFAGSSSGTGYATNFAAGFAGNHIDCQLAGVSSFKVSAAGNTTVNQFLLGSTAQGNDVPWRWGLAVPTPASDADITLTAAEYSCPIVVLQTGAWTSAHNVIVPATSGCFWIFHNNGSFDATVKTAAGAGIVVAAARVALLRTNGTDVKRLTADSVA